MSRIRVPAVPLLLVALLLAVPALAAGCSARSLAAPQDPSSRSITVTGRAVVSGKPDLAQANLGVETYAATVAEATQQDAAKMSAVMAKLKELGIADKDIQTSNYSINLERQGPAGPVGPGDSGKYRVSNMVGIKIRDLTKVGTIIDAAVQAGANQVWGVTFTIEDQKALETDARAKAVQDARSRAEALAKLSSTQLGQVLSVSEGTVQGPIIMRGGGMGAGAAEASMLAPISPGEVQVTFQLEVTYAIQ